MSVADASAGEPPTLDAGTSDAAPPSTSTADAGGAEASAPEEPPLTLQAALDVNGLNTSTARAMLVVDAACKARVPCGDAMTQAECVDLTLSEWALGALFFADECIDAQLDLYACFAAPECETTVRCAAQRSAQETLCALEQQ